MDTVQGETIEGADRDRGITVAREVKTTVASVGKAPAVVEDTAERVVMAIAAVEAISITRVLPLSAEISEMGTAGMAVPVSFHTDKNSD